MDSLMRLFVYLGKLFDMLGNQSLMAFVPVTDAGRARPFYEKTLGVMIPELESKGVRFERYDFFE
jgi:hypothetical protein